MARAKHRHKHAERQFASFVKKCERLDAHDEMLKAHRQRRRKQAAAIAVAAPTTE